MYTYGRAASVQPPRPLGTRYGVASRVAADAQERVPPAWPCASHPQGGLSPTIRKRHELNHHVGAPVASDSHLPAEGNNWYNVTTTRQETAKP